MARFAAAIILLALLTLGSAASACPSCKETVANTDGQAASHVGAGFNYSIFAMLGGLLATAGFVGRTLYKASQAHSAGPFDA